MRSKLLGTDRGGRLAAVPSEMPCCSLDATDAHNKQLRWVISPYCRFVFVTLYCVPAAIVRESGTFAWFSLVKGIQSATGTGEAVVGSCCVTGTVGRLVRQFIDDRPSRVLFC